MISPSRFHLRNFNRVSEERVRRVQRHFRAARDLYCVEWLENFVNETRSWVQVFRARAGGEGGIRKGEEVLEAEIVGSNVDEQHNWEACFESLDYGGIAQAPIGRAAVDVAGEPVGVRGPH